MTVASDEENVRLTIFDGVIPLGEAGDRLLELALAQNHRLDSLSKITAIAFDKLEAIHTQTLMPWPIRWWRYWRKNKWN